MSNSRINLQFGTYVGKHHPTRCYCAELDGFRALGFETCHKKYGRVFLREEPEARDERIRVERNIDFLSDAPKWLLSRTGKKETLKNTLRTGTLIGK